MVQCKMGVRATPTVRYTLPISGNVTIFLAHTRLSQGPHKEEHMPSHYDMGP
jgi:hypothetical protein